MRLIICDTETDFDAAFAMLIAAEVINNPHANLGMATGSTTKNGYGELVRLHRADVVSFRHVNMFSIDVDHGLPLTHPQSAYRPMKEQLFDTLDIPPAQCHFPDGGDPDGQHAIDVHVDAIEAHGGLDLQVLPLGNNGHIGLCQPGTPFGSTRLLVQLMDKHVRIVDGIRYDWGLTLGLKDIMHARKLLFCAKGEHKADIAAQALCGPVTEDVPASIVQLHPNAIVLLDAAAAGKMV